MKALAKQVKANGLRAQRLELTAESFVDERILTAMFEVFQNGGSLVVTTAAGDEQRVELETE